jgi:hypothetical protein
VASWVVGPSLPWVATIRSVFWVCGHIHLRFIIFSKGGFPGYSRTLMAVPDTFFLFFRRCLLPYLLPPERRVIHLHPHPSELPAGRPLRALEPAVDHLLRVIACHLLNLQLPSRHSRPRLRSLSVARTGRRLPPPSEAPSPPAPSASAPPPAAALPRPH